MESFGNKIMVPDLYVEDALEFCRELYEYNNFADEVDFDFSKVKNCDPFPMLVVSKAIREKIRELRGHRVIGTHCENSYADYMKFYRACGFERGDSVDWMRGNNKYKCITRVNVSDWAEESLCNLDVIQETVDRKAGEMAAVLAQSNREFENWLRYVIRELLRNIPEHSESKTIWYCAQYWPKYDLVELAIMDEGIGICRSLKESSEFVPIIASDSDALQLALQPGVSGTFSSSRRSLGTGEWENSGYGLYMVSQMCAEFNADFVIASGDSAVVLNKRKQSVISTQLGGTAIQIRIRPSINRNYDEIRKNILLKGEKMAKNNSYAIHSASKSSRGFN